MWCGKERIERDDNDGEIDRYQTGIACGWKPINVASEPREEKPR